MEKSAKIGDVFTKTVSVLIFVSILSVGVCQTSVAQTPRKPATKTKQHSQVVRDLALVNAIRASDKAAVEGLLRLGSSANAKDRDGTPAILIATQNGATSIVQMLLNKGASVDARDKSGTTALMITFRKTDILRLLLKHGANPNLRLANEKRKNDMSMPDDVTILMFHVWIGTPEGVRLLLEHGARVNDVDANGWSALMWTATRPIPDRTSAAALAELLIAKGANVNATDKKGNTPLMVAANFLKTELIRVLVKRGAKINARNGRGETALMLAVSQATSFGGPKRQGLATIKFLLDSGADAKIADKSGETPLTKARFTNYPDIETLLQTGKIPLPPARLQPRPRDLMQIAKPIATWSRDSMSYMWKTANAMFIQRQIKRGESYDRIWFERDLKTGREKSLTKILGTEDQIAFSPDGNWALTTDGEDSEKITWKAVGMNSNIVRRGVVPPAILKRYITPYLYATSWTWAPDNRRWVWAPESLGANYSGDNVMPLVVFSLNSSAVREVKVTVQNKGELLPAIVLGFTAPDRVLSTSGATYNKSSTRSALFEFDISQPKAKSRRINVVLPVLAKAQALLSPRGNRLAWLLQVEDGERDFVEVWLSRSDGSQMRGVGAVEIKSEADLATFRLDSFQWRPDGKQLTFINNLKMYAIDVTD